MQGQIYLKNVTTLKLDKDKCTGCTMCTIVCPHRVFVMKNKKAHIAAKDLCMECGACQINCPAEAIFVKTGVGCAAGIINGLIKGTEASCDCNGNSSCC